MNRTPPGLAGLEDRDDVRVVYRGRDTGFPDEPAAERLVAGKRGGEDLQRDAAAEPVIEGTVDNGHAPRAMIPSMRYPAR